MTGKSRQQAARRFPVLTVHNPWAWALLHGKPVENWAWKLGYCGPLWLHAGKAWDDAGESSSLVQVAWQQYIGPPSAPNRWMGTKECVPRPGQPADPLRRGHRAAGGHQLPPL